MSTAGGSAFRHRDFSLFWTSLVAEALALQMAVVAIGWQVYSISGSALDLGLIGLAEFLPLLLLALPAGHLADRLPRRNLLTVMASSNAVVLGGLLAVTVADTGHVWPFFALAFVQGIGSAIGAPAGRALTPSLVPQEILVSAYLRDWTRRNPITDADVQKEYDRAKAAHGDKEYRARHILVATEDEAKALIAQLKKGGKFDDLASKNSKDSGSATRGGDLDWNVPATYDKQFSDAMVKLEKGKYTEALVKTRFGFHIIQLDDVRPAKFATLAEVKPRIQQALVQNKIQELVKGLRAKAKVE